MAITSSKWPCFGQSFTIRILPSRSMICALISPTFSLSSTSCGSLPSRICWRISGTQRGQRESVVRGHPSGGFCFSYDFSSGLSDHFGVNDGFWLIWLRESNTCHAPFAATAKAFSTYFTGLCILCLHLLFFTVTAIYFFAAISSCHPERFLCAKDPYYSAINRHDRF